MQPRIKEVLDHLDTQHQELRDAVNGVPISDRTIQPAPGCWSVVDVLEHLAITETNIAGMLKARIAEGRAGGIGAEVDTSSVINPRHVAKVRDRSIRITAGEASLPKSNLDPDAAWRTMETARTAVRAVVAEADGLALGEISHPHRIFGPLNVYQWISFVGSHESRHAAQIREIGATLQARRS